MVNFNNESTIGTPAIDVVRILVLQARANLLEAWEVYRKQMGAGIQADINVVYARSYTLFDELRAGINRGRTKEQYEELENWIKTKGEDSLIKAFEFMNAYLDGIRLTRLDTKQVFDRSRFEEENKEAGL